MNASAAWGPMQRKGAISLTFDNLGEAAALRRGDPVPTASVGQDPTASFISRLLAVVGDLPCTWFIEASNATLYPAQIRSWHEAGKEVGIHAWQHEHWAELGPSERVMLLGRCQDAFDSIGVTPRGFRPPGGLLPPGALDEFREADLAYCSPLGTPGASGLQGRLAVLPFAWPHVDAYMLDPTLAAFREQHGDPAPPGSLAQWRASLEAALAFASEQQRHVTVIFHPYLLISSVGMLDELHQFVSSLRARADVWIASCSEVSDWLHRGDELAAPSTES